MIALALPYVRPPTLALELPRLGDHMVTAFGPIAAIGIIVGFRISMQLARERGLSVPAADRLVIATTVGGLVFAHWFSVLLYYPHRVLADPWILLMIHRGLSSVGGFIGGLVTFAWVTRRRGLDARAYADVVAVGLLAGFTIGGGETPCRFESDLW